MEQALSTGRHRSVSPSFSASSFPGWKHEEAKRFAPDLSGDRDWLRPAAYRNSPSPSVRHQTAFYHEFRCPDRKPEAPPLSALTNYSRRSRRGPVRPGSAPRIASKGLARSETAIIARRTARRDCLSLFQRLVHLPGEPFAFENQDFRACPSILRIA